MYFSFVQNFKNAVFVVISELQFSPLFQINFSLILSNAVSF